MKRLRLTPQKREFYGLYGQAAANCREIARLLLELVEGWPASRDLLQAIRDAEHEGDRLTHEVITLLNGTFVTPFERDDMYRLATVLDDICDHVDEAADDIDAYEVTAQLDGTLVSHLMPIAAVNKVPGTLWIDKDSNRLVRITVETPQEDGTTAELTLDLTDFGVETEITPPA